MRCAFCIVLPRSLSLIESTNEPRTDRWSTSMAWHVLPEQVTNMRDSAVPNLANVLMPETFLKKRKSDAKVREEKQSKAAELRKVCF